MFNDLWKKFKTAPSDSKDKKEAHEFSRHKTEHLLHKAPHAPKAPHTSPHNTQHLLHNTDAILNAFYENEAETLDKEVVLENLHALKTLVNEPKEDKPELRFSEIKKKLGPKECHETVRQERWPDKICCPKCQSTHLKQIAQVPSKSPLNHRYECLECGTIFNDDSESPMEKSAPPLNTWMQCWYLLGCSDNIAYIATKLNLDHATVQWMIRELQKFFKAEKPLSNFKGYAEWSEEANRLREQLKSDLIMQYELLNANVATAPRDTAEFRRQQRLRRDLDTEPKSTTPGAKKRS